MKETLLRDKKGRYLKITIVEETLKKPDLTNNGALVDFRIIREWIRTGEILKHLFFYQEAEFIIYSMERISRPFLSILLLRLLSRGLCFLRDQQGRQEVVTFFLLSRLLWNLLKDYRCRCSLLQQLNHQIKGLLMTTPDPKKRKLEMNGTPVYLRTDLSFGIRSGGSVAHIAGVINNLGCFLEKPIFLTTDKIPTVRKDLETHLILPGGRFWDFKELLSLHFNEDFLQNARILLNKKKISFIYQRYSLNNFSGVVLSKEYRVPFVLEYNGSEIWMSRNWTKPLRYERLSERIELLDLNAADVIVVVSRSIGEELVAHGIDSEKVLVTPNGVDPDRYSPCVDGSGIRRQYSLQEKTVIGFIGTFGRWHGAEVLAEAFGRLLLECPVYRDRVSLLMIGDGIMMMEVRDRLKRLQVGKAAHLTGLVPQEEGPAYLAACDILVASHVPNSDGTPFFGSPTKLFEYMAMGKGIVASDLDQVGEILRHDVSAWLVNPGDAASLMQGLKVLIDDAQKREKLGRAARQEVIAKYTWKEHTRRIIEKLKERCE